MRSDQGGSCLKLIFFLGKMSGSAFFHRMESLEPLNCLQLVYGCCVIFRDVRSVRVVSSETAPRSIPWSVFCQKEIVYVEPLELLIACMSCKVYGSQISQNRADIDGSFLGAMTRFLSREESLEPLGQPIIRVRVSCKVQTSQERKDRVDRGGSLLNVMDSFLTRGNDIVP